MPESSPRMTALFRKYDADHDNFISETDLLTHANLLANRLTGQNLPARRTALNDAYTQMWTQLAAVADADRGGRISEQEFLAATARGAFEANSQFRTSTIRAVNALAEALDANGDGRISPDEYSQLFALTGTETVEGLGFGYIDADADGYISREELRTIAIHLFPLSRPEWLSTSDTARPTRRGIALVAHDARKADLVAWATTRRDALAAHTLYGTGTTGTLLNDQLDLKVNALRSGPLGGDQQIGSRISEGDIDTLIFFWDPLSSHPHGDDVRALIRLAVLADIPVALNAATADEILARTSELVDA